MTESNLNLNILHIYIFKYIIKKNANILQEKGPAEKDKTCCKR